MLIYEQHLPTTFRDAFTAKVQRIAAQLGIPADWLMGVMWQESRLRPAARNAGSGATGLIQFMPATATALGTTTDALAAMDALAQLDWVQKYFAPYAGKLHSFADTYFAVFFPAAIGKPDSWVLSSAKQSAYKVATYNNIYDLNRDGQLTVAEVKNKLPDVEGLKKKRQP
ncbi:MAG: transglycosylase SLT domain-containing protein [Prevotellaceae bacterium]|nr:transglycosylase SLT domain-containing protein [Prevotellaceae bacterium]